MADTVYISLVFVLTIFLLVNRILQILPQAYISQPLLQLRGQMTTFLASEKYVERMSTPSGSCSLKEATCPFTSCLLLPTGWKLKEMVTNQLQLCE